VPRPWYLTITPAFLGLFVWAPFFDQLWAGDLTRHELPWLFGSAAVAAILCFGLYFIAASWGLAARRPLAFVAASTFGPAGSDWITGIAIAAASIVWYGVAIDFSVDSILLGLHAAGLIAPADLAARHIGPFAVKSPVYLCTALFWIYITGTAGLLKLAGVVVALMRFYAPIALLLLTAVALWFLPSLASYRLDRALAIATEMSPSASWRGHDPAWQMILGFFAMTSLASVDHGAEARGRRDVVLGGLTGIVLAAAWTASMALIVTAGAIVRILGTHSASAASTVEPFPFPISFRWAVFHGIGGAPAGTILILFGLAALAPACYAARVYGETLSNRWPRLGHWGWTWIGGAIALFLAATSNLTRLELIYSAMGAVFAPAIGAIAGDWLQHRGRWPGIRHGPAAAGGVIAWGSGLLIALASEFARAVNPAVAAWAPAFACGFAVSFVVSWLLCRHEAGE
jgi:hypothetical protein